MSGLNTSVKPLVLAISLASHQTLACESPITVDSLTDENGTSFHEAMVLMDACPENASIEVNISDTLAGTTITLDPLNLPYYLQSGKTVSINGPESADVTITDNAEAASMFVVQESANATIKDLKLYGGDLAFTREQNPIQVSNATLSLDNVTASHFHVVNESNGGVIRSTDNATLNIDNSVFEDNESGTQGAAVYVVTGSTQISNSQFRRNTTTNDNLTWAGRAGGAIASNVANLTIIDSVFEDNSAAGSGGAISAQGEMVNEQINISGSTFRNNQAINSGGAIHQQSAHSFSITDSTFEGNSVKVNVNDVNNTGINISGHGGAVHSYQTRSVSISESNFLTNDAENLGGALYIDVNSSQAESINVDVTDSHFEGNTTSYNEAKNTVAHGAGIALATSTDIIQGTVTLDSLSFKSNVAYGNGGAIFVEDTPSDALQITIQDSTIDGNTAQNGAGILVEGTNTLSINSSLLSNNTATSSGSAVHVKGNYGSGEPTLRMTNTTITGNNAGHGTITISGTHGENSYIKHSTIHNNTSTTGAGAVYGNGVTSDDAILISHTIVSSNTGPLGELCQLGEANWQFEVDNSLIANADIDVNCRPFDETGGGNLKGSSDASIDPLIGSLQDNGGPTHTIYPSSGSPVIDSGNLNISTPPALDQRGSSRITGNAIDIGAVELNAFPIFAAFEDHQSEVSETNWDISFAQDPDGDDSALQYAVSGLPEGLYLSPTGKTVLGTITAEAYQENKSYEIEVTASDAYSSTTVTRTLSFINQAPVLPSFDNVSVAAGSTIEINYDTATDADSGIQIQYSVSGLPQGIEYSNGMIQGTATAAMIEDGPYTITVEASDGYDAVSQTFTLTVTEKSEDDDDGFLGLGSLNYAWLSLLSILTFRRKK